MRAARERGTFLGTANRDLKNKAYAIIKQRLLECVYAPGTFLNEAQLAADLGFSRTPVREAITRLELEKLVTVVPKKGIRVADVTLADVHQIFRARLEVEPVTLRMAAGHLPQAELAAFRNKFAQDDASAQNSFRLDTAMHLFLIGHCGNRYLIEMMQRLFEDNTRVVIASRQNEVQIHDARREHLEILDALLAGETEKAAALMHAHIETCRRAALGYFYSPGAYAAAPSQAYRALLDEPLPLCPDL